MLRSLTSAISGLQNFQERMDVIGNNIANVNTTGFKGARVDFSDSFSQTLRNSTPIAANSPGVSAMQVGSGVATGAIRNLYTQGAVARTGVDTDMAIAGEGYFVVRDSINDQQYATRSGNFDLRDGYLVSSSGQRLQGITDMGAGTIGDIRIDMTGYSEDPTGVTLKSWSIDVEGKVNVSLSNGDQFVRGQVLLQSFNDPQALMKAGNNLYSGIELSGPMTWDTTTGVGAPGRGNLGTIQEKSLELSNVDLATEFSTMITAQRAFQATARVITVSDDMLQELVNLKR
jgi:flagellar hook protein FlgE